MVKLMVKWRERRMGRGGGRGGSDAGLVRELDKAGHISHHCDQEQVLLNLG